MEIYEINFKVNESDLLLKLVSWSMSRPDINSPECYDRKALK